MREVVTTPSNYPARIGRFTAGQIAQRSTWGGVADLDRATAAMHVLHVVPAGASTITTVNPLDPATAEDNCTPETGWLRRPGAYGPLYRILPGWWMS